MSQAVLRHPPAAPAVGDGPTPAQSDLPNQAGVGDLPIEAGACALCGGRNGERFAAGWDFEYQTTRREFVFHRCACGGVYLDPRPAPAALAQIYPSTYYAYDFAAKLGGLVSRFKGFAERAKARAYLKYLRPGARVLDIGCGDGHVLDELRRAADVPLRLEGVEFAEPAARAAEHAGIRVHRGRIEDVELPSESFDLVIMNQLIEHVADPVALLSKIARVLAPGGVLFLETPNLASLDARLFRRRYWGGYHLPRHFHLFDTWTLPKLAARAGLAPVSLRPLVCPQFWILSLKNWLTDRGAEKLATRLFSPFNPLCLAPATALELVQQRLWWTSNLQMVARREAT